MKFKRTLRLSEGGGLFQDAGRLRFVDGTVGVEQELRTRLATVKGEDPFHPDFGLDVFEVAGAPPEILQREIRTALLDDDRVDSVDTIKINRRDGARSWDVDVKVTLVDGEPISFMTEVSG